MRELFELSTNLELTDTEVRTPPALVDEMLDRLPASVWSDPSVRFLDPCAGTGTFVLSIIGRLMRGLESSFPDRIERAAHVLANQVWAYDVCPRQVLRLRGGLRKLGIEHLARNVYNCNVLEQEFDMKFDVIVGNPPYNPPAKEDVRGSGTRNKIWQKFIEKAFDSITIDGTIAMLTPTNWRAGNFNDKRLHKKAQERIFHYGIHSWGSANHHFADVGVEIDWWISNNNSINIPKNLFDSMFLPKNMDANSLQVYDEWMSSLKDECYIQDLHLNDYRKFNHYRKSLNAPDSIRIYPHLNSGAQTKKNLYEWFDSKTKGFDSPKIIIHRTSGPNPFYDVEGKFGCGSSSFGYVVSDNEEAQELLDFFESKICNWLAEQASSRKSFIFPCELFKRIPKNWRELEEKHFG